MSPYEIGGDLWPGVAWIHMKFVPLELGRTSKEWPAPKPAVPKPLLVKVLAVPSMVLLKASGADWLVIKRVDKSPKKSYGLVRKLDLPPEQTETWESPTDHNAIAKPTVVGNDVDHHAVREEASRDVCGRHIGAAHLIRHPSYGVGLDPLQELLRGDATHVKDLAVGPHSRGHRSRRWGALECCAIRRRTLSLISWDVELFHGKSWTPCRTYLYTG